MAALPTMLKVNGIAPLCTVCGKHPCALRGRKRPNQCFNKCEGCLRPHRVKNHGGPKIIGAPSRQQYAEMLKNPCPICGGPMLRPARDHNHETGNFRAVICGACNALLGFARESTATLLRAVDYLNRHN